MGGMLNMPLNQLYSPINPTSQLFNGMPQVMGNPINNPMLASPVAEPKRKRITRFEKSRWELMRDNEVREDNTVSRFFFPCDSEQAIELLGWWNPMLGGKPKEPALILLHGIPSATHYQAWSWKKCGLMYFTPVVMNRKKTRARTSLAGLRLLRFWGTKHPRFQKYLDAFWTKAAEQAITLDCVDFNLGRLPQWFDGEKDMDAHYRERAEQHKALQRKIAEEARQRAAIEFMAQQKYNVGSQAQQQHYQDQINAMVGMQGSGRMADGLALQQAMDLNAQRQRQMMVQSRTNMDDALSLGGSLWKKPIV